MWFWQNRIELHNVRYIRIDFYQKLIFDLAQIIPFDLDDSSQLWASSWKGLCRANNYTLTYLIAEFEILLKESGCGCEIFSRMLEWFYTSVSSRHLGFQNDTSSFLLTLKESGCWLWIKWAIFLGNIKPFFFKSKLHKWSTFVKFFVLVLIKKHWYVLSLYMIQSVVQQSTIQ